MSAVDEMSKQKVEEVSQVVKQDCQPCRYLGTGLFLFTASYIWYHTKGAFYRGSLYKRIPLRVAAVGSMYMSVARFIYLPPFKHLAPEKHS